MKTDLKLFQKAAHFQQIFCLVSGRILAVDRQCLPAVIKPNKHVLHESYMNISSW